MRATYYEITQRRDCVRVNRYTERQYEAAKARRDTVNSVKQTALQCTVLMVGFIAFLLVGSVIEALTTGPAGTILLLLGCMFVGSRLLELEEEKSKSGGKGRSKDEAADSERGAGRSGEESGVVSEPYRGNRRT